ncbi:hypothetical protein AC1031_000569 [Aphanomyces cochlioides]|nr:hypothetical protein AC1031_000569 [Aphanomyces cochlioides]
MRPPSYDSIPLKENDQQVLHPLETASFFSRVFYLWANPLMKLGNQRQLDFADLWPLQRENRCDVVSSEFSVKFREMNSILKAFLASYGWQTAMIGLMQFLAMVCSLCGPIVLERVVSNIGVADVWSLFGLVAALFGTNVLQAILQNQSDLLNEVLYVRLTAALQHLLYEKALVLNAKSRKGTGELTNLFTADMWQVLTLSFTANQVWIVPLQVIAVMFLLWQILGLAMLVGGIGIIVLVLTLNRGMATTQKENWKVLMERRDARMKVINEVFNAIANVKMNAWEERYLDIIRDLRDAELDSLRRHVWIFGGMSCMHHISPVVLISLSFASYVFLLGQELAPAKVFTSLALFGMVNEPMMRMPHIIATWMLALVSYHRFADFLALEERDPNCVTSVVSSDDMSIEIRDGSFGWDAKKPSFQDLQLTIKRGEFVVVHGSVGEGKSTLCNILLGELDKYQGSVGVNGRIAYFAQQPWIQNLTIRDNILFGLPYDHAKYTKVIDACALGQDLMLFAAGDLTEIGSKGVNVSGGQKARISLARACYSDADIFILDSPLSAVDAIVQNELYTKCLLDLLRHKTILLVTHNPDIIASPYVDRTIEIKDGKLIEKINTDKKMFTPVASKDGVYAPSSSAAKAKGALVVAEERVVGRVSKDIVKSYFEAFGGWTFIISLFSFQALGQVTQIASDLWLSYSISAEKSYYLSVYSLIALAAALVNAGRTIMVLRAGIGAAKDLFDGMCRALFYAPLRFFDVTPIGRILTRFSGDMNQVDFPLPGALRYLTSLAFSFIFSLGTAVAVIRTFGLALLPILWIYYSIASFYVMPAREIERLSKTSKSHMISHIAESIDGVAVIRAFGHLGRFKQVHHKNVDHRNETMFCNDLSGQWFALRIQLIGASMLFVITSSLVFSNLSPGMIGLVFNYALQIMLQLQGLVQAWSSLETAMVAPERVSEYTNVEQEGMRVVPRSVSSAWPQDGSITFQGVSYRYKPNDPLVLHDVCFEIQSGEKIGIVGRTGAGKSSLTMALFRMNEIASGTIQIGGVSTATIGLKTLRESMAIIPQNPILFKGTLRSYLDPFDDYTDAELWNVLAKVQLTSRISNEADKLLSVVQENGENFSVGERQMLCMARALLRQCRIVVMDEATAAIDHETDQTLQRVIRQEFATSTVVTIAHRLNTVLDSDRILVLDQGRLVQFDSPSALIQEGHGIFYELCQEDGGFLGGAKPM